MNENTSSTELATLPPPERAAVALQSSATEKHLRELVAKTAEITNVVDANGREEAHRAGMTLKKARATITATGKAAREDATAFSKAVIAEEKRLLDITDAEEERVFGLRDAYDAKVAAEKAEAARKEAERKASIIAVIDGIRRLPAEYAGYESAVLTDLLATLAQREATEEEFAEFASEARLAIDTTASALLTLREGAIAREEKARQDAEARRLEAERLAAERAALALQKVEQERIAAEQAAAARALAEQQAAMLAQQQAEAKRQQDEANARERAAAEQRRIEQEAADAERRKIEQAAAELAEQRAAFAREQEAAAQRQRAADQAEADRIAAAEQAIADAQQQVTEAREELIDRIDVNAPIEAIVHVLEIVSEDKPSDEELILLMCATFDMLPFEAIERLSAFNAEVARERHPLPE